MLLTTWGWGKQHTRLIRGSVRTSNSRRHASAKAKPKIVQHDWAEFEKDLREIVPSRYRYVRACYPTYRSNPYPYPYSTRKSLEVPKAIEELADMSLIIPCFTEREIPSKMEEQMRSCTWLDGYYFPRYFGVLDLDVPLDEIKNGKAPMYDVEGVAPMKFSSKEMTKTLFIRHLKELGGGKLSWALQHSKGFNEIYNLMREVCKLLEAQSIPHIAFFTGGAGFRVLFRDPRLYFLVGWWQSYSTVFSTEVWPAYLRDVLKCPGELANKIIANTDSNIYDRDKSVKPDLHPHYTTRQWPVPVDADFENKTLIGSQDMELNKNIHEFWKWVLTSLPTKMHLLRAPIPRTVTKAFEKIERDEDALDAHQNKTAAKE